MTAVDRTIQNLTKAKAALRAYAERISVDPTTNSVFDFAQELFRDLEAETISLDQIEQIVQELYLELLLARGDRFREQHQIEDCVSERLEALAREGWDAFQTTLETPTGGVVFTAHPTFALSSSTRAAFAEHISKPDRRRRKAIEDALNEDGRVWSQSISLRGEHDEAQATIVHAQAALNYYAQTVFETARKAFPDQWRSLNPALPTLASWVG